MSEPVLTAIASATELVVRFGNQVVLDRASLTILEGERVGLVGRNGSGKSTFLQIATGVTTPDSGEYNPRRDLVVGYMPQMFELDESATVHGNILAGAQRVLDLIADTNACHRKVHAAESFLIKSRISMAGILSIGSRV